MKTTDHISQELSIESKADQILALQCASKIRSHLSRLVKNESKIKYVNNMEVLDDIVDEIRYSSNKVYAI